jgi:hypothetical protein
VNKELQIQRVHELPSASWLVLFISVKQTIKTEEANCVFGKNKKCVELFVWVFLHGEGPRSRCYGRTTTLRLFVQFVWVIL